MDGVEVDGSGSLARGFSAKQVPALSVHRHDRACLSLLAYHGICFPVASDGTVRCAGRTIFDGGDMTNLSQRSSLPFL